MLITHDDLFVHQAPRPLHQVATSDHRFFERCWFAVNDPAGGASLQFTLGIYRNLGVVDAGAVISVADRQFNVRASGSVEPNATLSVGPLRVEIIEPMRVLRFSVIETDGVSCDVTWEALCPATEEGPHHRELNGRVMEDYRRFNQVGRATGWFEVDGQRTGIDDWWACRDRSWGVRPGVGGPAPAARPAPALAESGFLMGLLFFSTDESAGHLHVSSRGDGSYSYVDGQAMWGDPLGEDADQLEDVTIDFDLVAGTRRFEQVLFECDFGHGGHARIECTALGRSILMRGLGYSGGFNDHGGLGRWRGDLVVESDVWEVGDPTMALDAQGQRIDHWHRIQPVTVQVMQGGRVSQGTGSLTFLASGRLPEYGLE